MIIDLPAKDQHMAHLQDRLQEDIEYIRKVEVFNAEDINHLVGQASVNAYLLEDMCKDATEEVTCLEAQLAINEVTMQVFDPMRERTIAEEDNALAAYVFSMAGPT